MIDADEAVRLELRDIARQLLGDQDSQWPAGDPPAPEWSVLAAAGWLGLEIPEAFGGAAASFAEVAVIVEELGRAAADAPFLGCVVLGVPALLLVESSAARDRLLARAATGEDVVCLCLPAGDEPLDPELPFRVERSGRKASISGRASAVLDAPQAGRLLLPAADPVHGTVLVAVSRDAAGVTVERQPIVDYSRSLGQVVVNSTVAEPDIWRLDDAAALTRLRDRAALALALDSVGIVEAVLAVTVAHASDRRQFGRPIGSFQAVKHACADVYVALTASRELVDAAVRLVTEDDPSAAVAVSMAKSYACTAAVAAAGIAMQLHGGIGYTWENGNHLYLKRAILNRSLFGSPRDHRARLARSFDDRHPPAASTPLASDQHR
jgi:alkylation response protein AidB-like acyl-CoA dehydrogenase